MSKQELAFFLFLGFMFFLYFLNDLIDWFRDRKRIG